MINWHGAGLVSVEGDWVMGAALHVNPRLIHAPADLLFAAVTRLDVSANALAAVPVTLFQLPSLIVLNLSKNRLSELPVPPRSKSGPAWNAGDATFHCHIVTLGNMGSMGFQALWKSCSWDGICWNLYRRPCFTCAP